MEAKKMDPPQQSGSLGKKLKINGNTVRGFHKKYEIELALAKEKNLSQKESKIITIEGRSDKRASTGTFTVSHDVTFPPMQFIYGGNNIQPTPVQVFLLFFAERGPDTLQ